MVEPRNGLNKVAFTFFFPFIYFTIDLYVGGILRILNLFSGLGLPNLGLSFLCSKVQVQFSLDLITFKKLLF